MFTVAQLEKAATFYDEGHPDRILIEEAILHGMAGYEAKLATMLRPLMPRLQPSAPVIRRNAA